MSDIADRVKKIVVENLGVDAGDVNEAASFIDDLGADSLDTVELVMAFEEEFGIEIPDDAAETILTVADAVKFIERRLRLINHATRRYYRHWARLTRWAKPPKKLAKPAFRPIRRGADNRFRRVRFTLPDCLSY